MVPCLRPPGCKAVDLPHDSGFWGDGDSRNWRSRIRRGEKRPANRRNVPTYGVAPEGTRPQTSGRAYPRSTSFRSRYKRPDTPRRRAAGVPPTVASVLMGHPTPERQSGAATITLSRYTHALHGSPFHFSLPPSRIPCFAGRYETLRRSRNRYEPSGPSEVRIPRPPLPVPDGGRRPAAGPGRAGPPAGGPARRWGGWGVGGTVPG